MLEEKEGEVEDLKEVLRARGEELQKTKLEIAALKNRVSELENLKVTSEGKTLIEAEKAFLEAMEREVERRAYDLFNSMKAEWASAEKPKEVFREAVELLKQIIEKRRKPVLLPKELVDLSLPEKVEEVIRFEVERRLDLEFQRRVEEESSRKASAKLRQKVEIEWPRWYKAIVKPKARELEAKILTNTLKLLKGPWTISCDKCATKQTVELTPEEIEILLRYGWVVVECQNPNRKDLLWKHKIKVVLSNMISTYITGSL